MKLLFYLIVYSFLGFVLERIINIVYFGTWIDNSVLYGPYQPMYGLGVILTLIFYQVVIKRMPTGFFLKTISIVIAAIIFTGVSEYTSGTLYEMAYDKQLWDYQASFSLCNQPYVCIIPTGLFGILSALTVVYIHPIISMISRAIPTFIKYAIIGIFLLDIIVTYYGVML
ncbi:MAG: putative ABC transporter permease [Bacillota bacterium]